MKVARITTTIVQHLPRGQSAWAGDLHGFHVRKQRSDKGAYAVAYRFNGVQKYFKLGSTQVMTPAQAYALAKDALFRVSQGQSPADERDERKAAGTVADLIAAYLDAAERGRILRRGKRQKTTTLKTMRSRLKWAISRLGAKPVNALSSRDVEAFLHAIASESSGSNASAVVTLLASVFAWGVKTGAAKLNPCKGVERFKIEARERTLTEAEWRALGANLAASKEWPHTVALFTFLAHTGWRRSEPLALKFSDVDLQDRKATLADTKTGRSERLLSRTAVAIIERQRSLTNGDLVFPSPSARKLAIDRPWSRVRPATDVLLHTLRHSYASIGGETFPEIVVAGLLGHSKGGVTAGYQHIAATALKDAADAISTRIANLMSGSRQ